MRNLFIRTDQWVCYDARGNIIPCAKGSQDGGAKAGTPWPEPRFSDDGDVVLDRLTGLTWSKNASLSEFPLSWQEAFAFIDEMRRSEMFGFSEWRLPTRRQLFSLVSHVETNPTLPEGHPFVNVFGAYYWTSTEVSRYPSQAWYIHFGGGRVFKGMKHGSYMVWPVTGLGGNGYREGTRQAAASYKERFVDRGETVVDRETELEWTKDANPLFGTLDWTSALEAVERVNAESAYGRSDWRLPNVRELESLVCTESHSPALSDVHPFENVQTGYWSSTTSTYEPTYAWVLYMEDGAIGVGFKEKAEFSIWPVRSVI